MDNIAANSHPFVFLMELFIDGVFASRSLPHFDEQMKKMNKKELIEFLNYVGQYNEKYIVAVIRHLTHIELI